ncbi:MAG TPA: hypothetical protein VK369_06865 [Segetibacter sp.]|jgi:hypothetical protein|nr:hypothetical protein [Segetibacter sp.]
MKISFLLVLLSTLLFGCKKVYDHYNPDKDKSEGNAALKEVNILLETAAQQRNVSKEDFMKTLVDKGRFTAEQNVFLPSTLAVDFTENKPTVTLPVYKGIGPSGNPTYYVLTEAADYKVAKMMGLNFAPRLVNGRGTAGSQQVTIENGMMKFKGDVDFSPVRTLAPGKFPNTFPPSIAKAGSIGDAEYSPLVVLQSGSVMNAIIVANGTGEHDNLVSIDYKKGTVVFKLLDGFQGGDQYFYHISTESNDTAAATVESATYTPRLANLPEFGKNMPMDKSALLGFSPTANGETGVNNPQRQGLNSTILDALAPINIFPLDPDNTKQENNNYTPMWDAHINVWTPAAIQAGKRRRITGFEDLEKLFAEGSITNAPANAGNPNSFVAGLKPSKAIINCPVIAQPVNP